MDRRRFITRGVFGSALTLAHPALARKVVGGRHAAAIRSMETEISGQGDDGSRSLLQRMDELKVPGVSLAFLEDGEVAWARAYGLANVIDRTPATPDTLFQAASMSKAVAAAGALRLVDEGKLDLDEDVSRRLRGWRIPESAFGAVEKVTLRRLLSHTAGLTISGFSGYAVDAPVPTTEQVLLGESPANTEPVRRFAEPGHGYAYSGGGYVVTQLLMSEVAAEAFPDLMDTLVLQPLSMSRSTFEQPVTARWASQAASAHDSDGHVIAGRWHVYPEYAAAGLWTTPSDYGRFLTALQDGLMGKPCPILKPQTAHVMATPVAAGYGLGIGRRGSGGRSLIEHGGSNEGFRCSFAAFTEGSRQGVVIMTNGDQGRALCDAIMETLTKAYGWAEFDPLPERPRAPDN